MCFRLSGALVKFVHVQIWAYVFAPLHCHRNSHASRWGAAVHVLLDRPPAQEMGICLCYCTIGTSTDHHGRTQ